MKDYNKTDSVFTPEIFAKGDIRHATFRSWSALNAPFMRLLCAFSVPFTLILRIISTSPVFLPT